MSESGSEAFKKQRARCDSGRGSLISNPWDFENHQNFVVQEHDYPYKGFDAVKPAVMKRDNYTCQKCGAKPKIWGLTVHHKDGNKFNHAMDNLVTLCNSCHASLRRNRKRISREQKQIEKWRRNTMLKRELEKKQDIERAKGQETLPK